MAPSATLPVRSTSPTPIAPPTVLINIAQRTTANGSDCIDAVVPFALLIGISRGLASCATMSAISPRATMAMPNRTAERVRLRSGSEEVPEVSGITEVMVVGVGDASVGSSGVASRAISCG